MVTEDGKPYSPLIEAPYFSISHSHHWVSVAFAQEVELGIDIEQLNAHHHVNEISERFFTTDEHSRVLNLGTGEFFRIWTQKESWAKATGKGLFNILSRKGETMEPVTPPATFIRYDVDPEYACCLAHEGPLRTYSGWRLESTGESCPVPVVLPPPLPVTSTPFPGR